MHFHRAKVKSTPRSHHDIAHLHPQPMALPSINFLYFMVSYIWPRQDFEGQGHCKAKTLNHGYTMMLHIYSPLSPQQLPLTSSNFQHHMVSEIYPRQYFKGQGHYSKVKGQIIGTPQPLSLPSFNFRAINPMTNVSTSHYNLPNKKDLP